MTKLSDEQIQQNLIRLVEEEHALIDEHGFTVRSVFGGRGFSYSMGLYRKGHPDVIVFGLSPPIAHGLISEYYRAVEEGQTFVDGTRASKIVRGLDVVFRKFNPDMWDDYLGGIINHAAIDGVPEPECLVMVWPDPNGLFPWDDGFEDKFRGIQPPEAWDGSRDPSSTLS